MALRIAAIIVTLGPLLVAQTPQQPTFRASSDAVLVHALVQSGRRAVTGLTCDDFELLDSGVVQKLELCSEDAMPLEIVVLADASQSVRGPILQRIRTTAEQITSTAMSRDRVRLLRFASTVAPIATLEALTVQTADDQGHTSLLDAVATALMLPLEAGRRRLVFLLSDGVDTYSFVPWELVAGIVDRSDAVLQVLVIKEGPSQWGNLLMRETQPERYYWWLEDLAKRGGGSFRYVAPTTDLSDQVAEAVGELRTRYLLRYIPTNVPAGGWHSIELKIKRPGRYTVTARKGYQRSGSSKPF